MYPTNKNFSKFRSPFPDFQPAYKFYRKSFSQPLQWAGRHWWVLRAGLDCNAELRSPERRSPSSSETALDCNAALRSLERRWRSSSGIVMSRSSSEASTFCTIRARWSKASRSWTGCCSPCWRKKYDAVSMSNRFLVMQLHRVKLSTRI